MKRERPDLEPAHLLTTEQIADHVREIVRDTGGVTPTVLVETQDHGQVIALPDFGDTADERAQQMFLVGHAVGKDKTIGRVLQVSLVAECWISRGDSGQPAVRPSEDPRRRECVLIGRERLQPRSLSLRLLEILRDPAGHYRSLQPLETDVNEEMMLDNPLMDAFVLGYWTGSSGECPFNPLAKRH